jgi:hypothetical protein
MIIYTTMRNDVYEVDTSGNAVTPEVMAVYDSIHYYSFIYFSIIQMLDRSIVVLFREEC